jgi:acetolactate synthase-1/2/3 large subunit
MNLRTVNSISDPKNFADAIVQNLIEEGVEQFFIVAGGGIMFVHEAIRKSGVQFTCFHHEQAAAMAAEAYARVSGKLPVVCVTSGPGASNLSTGVAGAFLDSAPVLVIAGQSKTTEIVTDYMSQGVRQVGTFELPIMKMLEPITKLTLQASNESNPRDLVKALIAAATEGRPGPVYLEIPFDVQNLSIALTAAKVSDPQAGNLKSEIGLFQDLQKLTNDLIQRLTGATRPLVIAGYGVRASGQGRKFLEVIERLGLPVVSTQLAKDLIPFDHGCFVGHVGLRGDRAGNWAVQNADFIFCLGTSLQTQTTGFDPKQFAPSATKIVIDFDGSVSGKALEMDQVAYYNVAIDVAIRALSDSGYKLSKSALDWAIRIQSKKSELGVEREPHDLSTKELNLYEFIFALSEAADPKAVIVTDAGLCFYAMGQAFKLKQYQRYIVSGGLGSMGYALPAAIGASLAESGPVIAVTGDGSVQMNLQELATANLLKRDIVLFVINNGGYASIRNTQGSFFDGKHIGSSEESGVSFPNWKLISEAFGVGYLRIENRNQLSKDIQKALRMSGIRLIEVLCQQKQFIYPYVASSRNIEGNLVSDPLSPMSPTASSKLDEAILN